MRFSRRNLSLTTVCRSGHGTSLDKTMRRVCLLVRGGRAFSSLNKTNDEMAREYRGTSCIRFVKVVEMCSGMPAVPTIQKITVLGTD